jgi:glycosyltransferase involved in cell wall biosynthesis
VSAPIKVLLIAPSLKITGGQAVQASRLLTSLGRQEEIHIDFQPLDVAIGPLRRVRYVRTLVSYLTYWAILAARVWRYDILHVFTASYWSYNLWSLPALCLAKLYGKKIILNYRDGNAPDHLKNWPLAVPTILKMDRVVAPSGYLVDVFREFGIEAQTISNVIVREGFSNRKRSRLRPRFLHNRMLEQGYDVRTSIRAFALVQREYPEAELTVAHDGPLRRELEEYAKELGLKQCRFIGALPQSEMAALYNDADIYLTSPLLDCMPGSLLECYCSGLPVVATRAGGIPYIARHEETAMLVECGDAEGMAAAALRLLREPVLVEKITQTAWEEVSRYGEKSVTAEWVRLYRELMSR